MTKAGNGNQAHPSTAESTKQTKLMPCYFGKALKRLINWAVAARKLHTKRRTLASKLEVKAALR
jgi:hypothetical protein